MLLAIHPNRPHGIFGHQFRSRGLFFRTQDSGSGVAKGLLPESLDSLAVELVGASTHRRSPFGAALVVRGPAALQHGPEGQARRCQGEEGLCEGQGFAGEAGPPPPQRRRPHSESQAHTIGPARHSSAGRARDGWEIGPCAEVHPVRSAQQGWEEYQGVHRSRDQAPAPQWWEIRLPILGLALHESVAESLPEPTDESVPSAELLDVLAATHHDNPVKAWVTPLERFLDHSDSLGETATYGLLRAVQVAPTLQLHSAMKAQLAVLRVWARTYRAQHPPRSS